MGSVAIEAFAQGLFGGGNALFGEEFPAPIRGLQHRGDPGDEEGQEGQEGKRSEWTRRILGARVGALTRREGIPLKQGCSGAK